MQMLFASLLHKSHSGKAGVAMADVGRTWFFHLQSSMSLTSADAPVLDF